GVARPRSTLGGGATFLLGMSYYGGLGAQEEFVRRDLDDLERHGFNWLRVWATWAAFDRDVSAGDADGRPRGPAPWRALARRASRGRGWGRPGAAFARDVGGVDADGRPREPFLDRLRWLV